MGEVRAQMLATFRALFVCDVEPQPPPRRSSTGALAGPFHSGVEFQMALRQKKRAETFSEGDTVALASSKENTSSGDDVENGSTAKVLSGVPRLKCVCNDANSSFGKHCPPETRNNAA